MKQKIFFITIIFIIAPWFAHASEVNLGSFSVDEVQHVIDSPINFHVNEQKIAIDKNLLLSFLKIRPALKMNPNYNSEAENINFLPTDDPNLKIFYRFLNRYQDRYHIKISTSLSIGEDSLTIFLDKLKNDTRVNPQNAGLAFDGEKVSAFSISKNGYEISNEESQANIIKALEENPETKDITLVTKPLEPEITGTNLDKYGIKGLIGEGVSNFGASPKNRIHNIDVGAAKFNGVLIKPGEEFSFIKTLGPVDESTGYLPELVIKTDKTVPEFGGGMCQVSTTMFRAALNSGLKITARTNHAYPVSYYNPQGLDATVYIPNPDLRFINDTPSYILVQTRIVGTKLFFDFFGTGDGRQAKLVGPQVLEKNPDGSMKTVVYQEVYNANGDLIRRDTFKSNYKSPSLFPHPGEEKITEKPADWSAKQWKEYKKANGL
jgi:vancomycin resistance protein YoaR